MSVSIAQILRLPSMAGAELVAGRGGINNLVEVVNVLEYAHVSDKTTQLFEQNSFEGNELMITAFAQILDDVEAQLANIRLFHNAGAVGIVLYYVGFLLPEIDPRMIKLCDELDFPLICMPKGKANLRYSESISEIMFAIFQDRQKKQSFVSDLLERASNLPSHQRNLETLLRMLSDHLHASVILRDSATKECTCAFWPRSLSERVDAEQLIRQLGKEKTRVMQLGEGLAYFVRCPQYSNSGRDEQIFMLQHDRCPEPGIQSQTSELIHLFIHIWNQNRGKLVISELVHAIINNDVIQMHRLAGRFHVDVASLNQMWVFHPKVPEADNERLMEQVSEWFGAYSSSVLISRYEQNVVVFTHAPEQHSQRSDIIMALELQLGKAQQYDVVCWDCLKTAANAQQAYLDINQCIGDALKIYPKKALLRPSNILFAKECRRTLGDKDGLRQYRMILEQLSESDALLSTAETYLLDASSNMTATGKMLHVHTNTVKYRLHCIQDVLGYWPGDMPDAYPLYMAVSLKRLMKE